MSRAEEGYEPDTSQPVSEMQSSVVRGRKKVRDVLGEKRDGERCCFLNQKSIVLSLQVAEDGTLASDDVYCLLGAHRKLKSYAVGCSLVLVRLYELKAVFIQRPRAEALEVNIT